MRLVIAIVVWAAAVLGAVSLSSTVAHSVHTEQAKAAAAKQAIVNTKPVPPFNPASIKAASARSLFVGANFAHALALVRRHVGAHADVEMLEVFPGQLELTVLKGSTEISVTARVNGDYLSSSDNSGPSQTQVFGLAQILANVPPSLARRIAAHGHVPISKLNFMQVRIDTLQHRFYWYVYPQGDNTYFESDDAHSPIQEFDHGRPGRLIRG